MSPCALTYVSADTSLIEQWAYRVFIASAEPVPDERRRARFRAAALDPGRVDPGWVDPRRAGNRIRSASHVPFAAGLWLSYLLWLEATFQLFAPGDLEDVTAAEAAGLTALARARARFGSAHSFCPRCEAPNPRGAPRCRRCSREFTG